MSKFVRSSKYRHVFGTAAKPEECWSNIKLTKTAWDANYVAANPKFLAVCWQTGGGGGVGVLNQNKTGKLGELPIVSGHKAPVLDVDWSPFNDHILATASEDCLVKIWNIPEGGLTADLSESSQTLSGHGRKVGTVNFHPAANNVLASSGGDFRVKLWDIEKGSELFSVEGHTNLIQSVQWNNQGDLLSTFAKDKKLRVIDPRQQTVAAEVEAHAGVKGGRSTWLNDKLFSVGFSKSSERRFSIWDPKNLKEPLTDQGIDNSAGIIMPFFDSGSNVLFLAGKGDGNIRYYEIVDDNKLIYFLTQYSSTVPQQGMCALPKRGVNVSINEIMRFYKAMQGSIEPISFTVPRKSDIFQDDLFPDCLSEEAACTASEWAAGSTAAPKTRSMAPGFAPKVSAAPTTNFVKAAEDPLANMNPAELRAEVEKLQKRVAFLESELAKTK